jgi:hypothetical protein
MARFTNFKDWKTQKPSLKEKDSQKGEPVPGNAELLALIEELSEKRNAASRANDGLGRQIYDLDIRVAKLEMQKNELLAKRKELESAKTISENKKRTPRASHE